MHNQINIPIPTPARRDGHAPASDELRELSASPLPIDIIIAVFAFGVILGSLIA